MNVSGFDVQGCRLRFGGRVDLGRDIVIMGEAIGALVSLSKRQGGHGEKRALPGRPNGQRGAHARAGRGPWACGRGEGTLPHGCVIGGEQMGELDLMIGAMWWPG